MEDEYSDTLLGIERVAIIRPVPVSPSIRCPIKQDDAYHAHSERDATTQYINDITAR